MFSIVRTGLAAATQEIAVLSDNIANARTTGYKRQMARFEDVYSHPAAESQPPYRGRGALVAEPRRSHTQGGIVTSAVETDLAIIGNGMLVLAPPPGQETPVYTRNGALRLAPDGTLTGMDGLAVLSAALQPIVIPPELRDAAGEGGRLSALEIGADGTIMGRYGINTVARLGQIGLARFEDESQLRRLGGTLYGETPGAAGPRIGAPGDEGFGYLVAGATEAANVDMTSELTSLIRAQQAFGSSARLLQTVAEMDKRLIDR
ncbi:flagellar hook basal-body protein [Plastorhodobacter daqingensis]|uniref:Flagellar hook basal-body protein n=1 Tax=Plastorhodobacter daqingensis TaxID=1387281 RepID=A0ABW2UJA0_9RHOB